MASETDIKYEEDFVLNSRGMKLLATSWIPANENPKALIFMCHGYAMECSITMDSTARRLANGGYAVYEKPENKKKMRYLLGESMGGAVALLLHRKKPEYWDGAILAAPMCKIADDIKPNAFVMRILSALSKVAPTWQIVPTQDIIDVAFKVPEVRQQIRANQYCFKGKPRLRTGYELSRVATQIEETLNEVSLPFLILHGEEDRVTDPSVSKQLHEVASSKDKTLKLYPGMWHGLLYGEPPENLEIVFKDIFNWIEERSQYDNSRLEREQKQQNEESLK